MTASEGPTRVLVVEDDADDFQLLQEMLADVAGDSIRLEWARTLDAGQAALTACGHDAYLLDYRLGKGTGLELLAQAASMGCQAPLIFVTGEGDRELGLRALEAGASDYLVKGQFDGGVLERSLRYAIERKRHTRELEQRVRERTADLERTNLQLRESQEAAALLAAIVTSSEDAIISKTLSGQITSWNRGAEHLFGYTAAEAIGKPITLLIPPENLDEEPRLLAQLRRGEAVQHFETVRVRKNGTRLDISLTISPIRDARGTIVGASKIARDITERKRFEAQLRDTRSRLESTLAAGEIGTWEFDIVNNVVHADANLAAMFGVTADEAAGGPIEGYFRAIHPDDQPVVQQTVERAISGGDRYNAEYRLVLPGQPQRWVIARGRVERDPEGRALRLPGVVVDITAQREAEGELRETQRRYKLAMEAAELGAWNIDPSTNTLESDDRFRAIFHGTTAPISYEQAFAAIHPDDFERVRQKVAEATNPDNPKPYAEEYRVVHPDGKVLWVLGKGKANFDETASGRHLVSFDGTVSDITEQRELKNQLAEQADLIASESRRKDEFLAMLSHELRNPLAPIRSAVHLMRTRERSTEDPITKQAREIIERQVANLTRLVSDLLEVSRVLSGRVRLDRSVVDLNEVVRHAVETSSPIVQQHQHILVTHFAESPVWVDADATRLEEVLINLLTNAAKYTPDGGRIEIWSELVTHASMARFRIRDNGMGIDAELLPRVFDLFTQADRSLARSAGGLGIGLSLAHRLVTMHGGTIEAVSPPAGERIGSEFIVTLPRVVAPNDRQPSSMTRASATSSSELNNTKILVVDDNVDLVTMLAASLKHQGYAVQSAHTGEDGLKLAMSWRPDVVLLDIGLPIIDGYEIARQIRSSTDEHLRRARLIAVTGYGREGDKEIAREAGFDHHLVKPVDFGSLEAAIRESQA